MCWRVIRDRLKGRRKGMASVPRFPVAGADVTVGFWDLRPYSKPESERTYIHRAWDFHKGSNPRESIVAPEDGAVFYQVIFRNPTNKTANLAWPDIGQWYMFSNFFYDNMGAMAVVLARESGLIYCMCHLDVDDMFNMLRALRIPYKWERQSSSYNNYLRYVCTFGDLRRVLRGDVIGHVGNAGYSTDYHLHMQVHASRDYNSRIDPAELWPNMPIGRNGCGPSRGTREGADRIPASDLPLDYIRC